MDLLLNEEEVKEAIVGYIKTQGISTSGCDIDIALKAGRSTAGNKAGGTTATVSINKAIAGNTKAAKAPIVNTSDKAEEQLDLTLDTPVLNAADLADKEEAESETLGSGESNGSLFENN